MKNKLLIWDVPIRLFHWALVVAIAYAWYAIEIMEDLEQHFLAGYVITTLISFRIIWGFVGTTYARFRNFTYSPSETISYIRTLKGKNSLIYLGHNPAGALSAFAILLIILVQVVSGFFSTDDYYFGPLYSLVSKATASTIAEIHHINFDIIKVLVAIHIVAILCYRIFKKEKLVSAMFTGRKNAKGGDSKGIQKSKILLAAIIIALCAAAVYGLANSSFNEANTSDDYYY
jgi:cytochrome b